MAAPQACVIMTGGVMTGATGAASVVKALKACGVRTIFSLSGNQIMPVFDACIDAGIRVVHVRHEAAAVYMADAWAQLTGEIGVAMLTAGPGLANGLAPLYAAKLAESPVLLLSGDSALAQDGRGAFQELDQLALTRPLVKQARRSRSVQALAGDVEALMAVALSGRPGPVHLAMPFDLLQARMAAPAAVAGVPAAPRAQTCTQTDADRLMDGLRQACRPVILVGPGLSRSRCGDLLDRVGAATGAPVIPMESPRGLADPAGGVFADLIVQADLLVFVGKIVDFTLKFGDKSLFDPTARFMVLDPEQEAIDRAARSLGDRMVLAAQADGRHVLELLAGHGFEHGRDDWLDRARASLAERTLAAAEPPAVDGLLPRRICQAVQQVLAAAPEPILICDGGEFGQWAQGYCSAPKRVINGMAGSIGGGICYAIAAKIACPEATVIALMGDGTAGFHLPEFETAAREHAPFIAVIGNDSKWNAEYLIQVREYGPDRVNGCTLTADTRYELAAQALGGMGERVASLPALEDALARAVQAGRPACLNVEMHGLPAPAYAPNGASQSTH